MGISLSDDGMGWVGSADEMDDGEERRKGWREMEEKLGHFWCEEYLKKGEKKVEWRVRAKGD
jgi:hypothetical protein